MPRRLIVLVALAVTGLAGAAAAQEPAPAAPTPASSGVDVTPLAAPDAFTAAGRDTGLPPTLWAGASLKTVRTVLGLLAARPLTPAGAQLARRVLATGAPGPQGAQSDPGLAALRASALLTQGDAKAAAAVLARAPGVDRSPELARAVAEAALLAGDDPRACQTAAGLAEGRDDIYWLRLRTYCQAIAGQRAQAQLTFDLAQTQAGDPVFGRLMAAKLAAAGNPGAPAARNGLDVALSRTLGLDPAAAKPAPAVAAALAPSDPAPPAFDFRAAPPEVAVLAEPLARGEPLRAPVLQALAEAADQAEPRTRARAQAALLLGAALAGPLGPELRERLAALSMPAGRAPVGRGLAMDMAAQQGLIGETAILGLWILAEAGPAGPAMSDRVRIVRALHAAGLDADARTLALEGLANP